VKRIGLLVGIISMLLMAAPAYAYNLTWKDATKVHYNFSLTTTEGCASCHVTHTATVSKLLWGSYGDSQNLATQTAFCYVCHAGTIASPYDVEKGAISPNKGVDKVDSWAGAFGFDGKQGTTSRHDVENTTNAVTADRVYNEIPGNKLEGISGSIKGGFKCASCHDPHGGDKPNARMLKQQPLPGNGVIDTVKFKFDLDKLSVVDYAYDLDGNKALNNWCGQCHGKFNVGDDAGKILVTGDKHFRHPMNVDVNPTSVTIAPFLGNKNSTPNNGKNLLNCLTCHKAHGTNTIGHDDASWYRDTGAKVDDVVYNSVLLRLDKRGVCFDCHGAAEKNLEDYTTASNPSIGNK